MNQLPTFVPYLLRVAAVTLGQLLTLFGPGLLLVALISLLSGHVARQAGRALGWGLYVLLFGWLGTFVHEAGHAIMAMLFGFPISQFKVLPYGPYARQQGFIAIPRDESNPLKKIGYFFIGIGPIVFGALLIYAALLILFEGELRSFLANLRATSSAGDPARGFDDMIGQTLAYSLGLLAFVFQPAHWLDWRFYLFLYIAFSIGSSIQLSKPDIDGSKEGFFVIVVFWLAFNLVALASSGLTAGSLAWLSQSFAFFYAILAVVLLLNLFAALVLFLPAAARH